ncbi:MAG: 50S ribosomal protein L15 [Alphaproteobacteria bacterium]
MKLNQLTDNPGSRKTSKRLGRGIGSGKGKTGGRGVKGQKARSGVTINGFEGGQMPLHMRIPKRGFNVPAPRDYVEINLDTLQAAIDTKKIKAGDKITAAALVAAGVLRRAKDGVRLLGRGALKQAVTLEIAGASKSAIDAVEKAGGKITVTAPAREDSAAG